VTCCLLHFDVEVDYDSAATKQVILIGPFRVREDEYRLNYLGHILLSHGQTGLTGVPDWHVAASFRGRSRVSKNYDAGEVICQLALMEPWLQRWPSQARAEALKERFLKALASGGIISSEAVAKAFDQEMLAGSDKRIEP
jgi:hypothetical protein